MKIMIVGAGSVGCYMASQLHQSGHEVSLVDQDPEVVEQGRNSKLLADITWHRGDACEVSTLAEIGMGDADVVAAVTGDDEDNLVVSLLAKQEFGVPRVVARVNNPRNEWMFNDTWGIDVSVSTPHLLTALVEEAVSVGSYVPLLSLEGGKAHLAEVTLADTSPAIGKTISSIGLPREASVVAIVREGHVVSPTPDTTLRQNDEVLVLLKGEVESEVRAVLVG